MLFEMESQLLLGIPIEGPMCLLSRLSVFSLVCLNEHAREMIDCLADTWGDGGRWKTGFRFSCTAIATVLYPTSIAAYHPHPHHPIPFPIPISAASHNNSPPLPLAHPPPQPTAARVLKMQPPTPAWFPSGKIHRKVPTQLYTASSPMKRHGRRTPSAMR